MNKKKAAASLHVLTVFCTGHVCCSPNNTVDGSESLSMSESAASSFVSVEESAVESAVEMSSVEDSSVDLETLAP